MKFLKEKHEFLIRMNGKKLCIQIKAQFKG
jgi:hypothetical protein